MKTNKGITLIALVITVVVIVILSAVAIRISLTGGLFNKANEATFKNRMAAFKESTHLYVVDATMDDINLDVNTINAGDLLKDAVKDELITDISLEDISIPIDNILKGIKSSEKEYLAVYKGNLYYVSNDKIDNNSNQVQWCKDLGIPILEFAEPEGILVKNGKYELVNGIYMCTPQLNEGFIKEKTRYMNLNEAGYLTPGNWITDNPDEDWYDYANSSGSKWANILVENNGMEVYYVWIPRYAFYLDQTTQRSVVKFVNPDNIYKDEEGNEYTLEQLSAKESEELGKTVKYQVPEAFTFNLSSTNVHELPGFWAMKYTAGDISVPSAISYDMSVSKGTMKLKNITLNTNIVNVNTSNPNANTIAKFTIALNGEIKETITDVANYANKTISLDNLLNGDNVVNITALNSNGEVLGSMTKVNSPVVVNKPDLKGFNPDTTFYVTYDDNDVEHSTVPITEKAPSGWYEYGNSQWANIVTRNNDLETYFVWIPRYEFTLDQTNQRSNVKFLKETAPAEAGYQVPEAFWWDKDEDGIEDEGEQLTGFWAMKYTAGDEAALRFNTEVTATNSSIRTKGITGTAVGNDQVYKYYINGTYKGQSTTATDSFTYTGLNANTQYTILVEIRNSSTDAYIGTVVKQIKTIDANPPVLTGFNTKEKDENNNKLPVTYYVYYDSNDNPVVGNRIDGAAPSNWYDYSNSKWANIVVTDGTVTNGTITGATKTTYFVWIPRYEFMATSSQQKAPATARTEVRFISETSNDTDIGYQIPEAFTFNGTPLKGFWAMKYTAGE